MNPVEAINRTVSLIDNGHVCARLGLPDAALARFDKAIRLCRPFCRGSDRAALSLAQALDGKANALISLDRCLEAEPLFQESITLLEPLQHLDARGYFITVMNLGRACMLLDRHGDANEHFRAAAVGLRHHGFHADEALVLCNWGDLFFRAGRLANAVDALTRAVNLWETDPTPTNDVHRSDLAYALCSLADALQRAGRHREALAATERAVEIHRAIVCFTNLPADRAELEEVLQQREAIRSLSQLTAGR